MEVERNRKNMFLHGTLEVIILDAMFPLNCTCLKKKPAAYVLIKLGSSKVAETSHEQEQVWNQTFKILCAHTATTTITIKLRTKISVIGEVHIPANTLVNGDNRRVLFDETSFPLLMTKGKQRKNLNLRFRLRFNPVEFDSNWGRGFGGFTGLVDGVSFPQRSNCDVILYQDADHCSSFRMAGAGGSVRQPKRLWEDVYRAIDGAKHLVYIAGWSLNPKLVLVRDPNTVLEHAIGVTIGDLLKQKANDGVAVRVMLWDDKTSLPIIKNKGVMRTHDEDALEFFKHTKVICRLTPRLHHDFPTFFAHHQKTITVDAPFEDGHRVLMSFIGGLDLCDGRYDTKEHSLFQTLDTKAHIGDFYQTSIAGASLRRGGPREPWHDTHACVTGEAAGEAAGDILANFVQRWSKQCKPPLPTLDTTISLRTKGNWDVQVFRSIDHISAVLTPLDTHMENSIHAAYVEAIRRADRFIYIENQYFMGGCHLWEHDHKSGCKNLIATEIAMKVVSKIVAGERFAVYVVLPMWPEGLPESEAVQEMLHWTRLTMTMMYKVIGDAIRESGNAGIHPKDYLNFFCLANREVKKQGEFVPPKNPRQSTHYWKSQVNRRFMIYVHSKLMIVDDEYLLIGSANINQRSMDGQRDTEIAIGCHQRDYIHSQGTHPHNGSIHSYRMSLWHEHTGRSHNVFLQPESIECVRNFREIGDRMWGIYSDDEVVDMGGVHLVSYPMAVKKDGHVGDVKEESHGNGRVFPDTSAHIKGRRSLLIPPACTT